MTAQSPHSKVTVIGHTHPDTDSVCSAIAYAWLKNQISPFFHEAACAGPVSRETLFALTSFGIEPPPVCEDVSPQLRDIDFRLQPGIDPETSVLDAWNRMRDMQINTLCITGPGSRLLGLITLKDMAVANMDLLDTSMLCAAKTPYRNILNTLKGHLLVGDAGGWVARGRICIGTSPDMVCSHVQPGDIVLMSDREEVHACAISRGAACLVVCCGAVPSQPVLDLAAEHSCRIIRTDYDTYQAARLISTAVPVRHLMVCKDLLTFRVDTPLEEVRKTMAQVRFQYFPVLDEQGTYLGVVSRRNLLNLQRRQLILVDHNERSQAVEGLEHAQILEILDHHRLGGPETDEPVVFRNMPVGCTATIVYQLFLEHRITPPRQIAGLMLSAILSDTLMFRSPTSTVFDQNAAYALAELAELELTDYAQKLFEAGSDLTGKTAEELFFSDFKIFHFGQTKFGVGQLCLMTDAACREAEQLLQPYLNSALKKADISLLFFLLTNTPSQSSRLLFAGKNAPEILSEAFHSPVTGHSLELSGIVSRKKQFLPPLRRVLH